MYKIKFAFIYLFLSLTCLNLNAQDTLKTAISPIPLSEIAASVTEINQDILDVRTTILSGSRKARIDQETDTMIFSLNLLREDPGIQRINQLNFRSLTILEGEWALLRYSLESKQNEYSDIVVDLESRIKEIENSITRWDTTLSFAEQSDAPLPVITQIRSTLSRLNSLNEDLKSDSEFIQENLVQISNSLIFCDEIIENVSTAKDIVTRQFFELNQPPLWSLLKKDTISNRFDARRSVSEDLKNEVRDFAYNNPFRLFIHFTLFIIILLTLTYLFKDIKIALAKLNTPADDVIHKIIKRPLSASLLVAFLLTYLLYGTIPLYIGALNILFLMIPVLIILTDILPVRSRRYIFLPVAASILVQLHSYISQDSFISRLFLVSIITFSLASFILIVRRKTFRSMKSERNYGRLLYYLAIVYIVFLLISLFASIAGAVMLSEYLFYAVARSIVLGLIIYALGITVNSIIYTSIYSKSVQKLNLVAQYHHTIYRRISQIVNILIWMFWIIITLRLFNAWDKVLDVLKHFMSDEFNIGTVSLTIGSLFLFFLIIWFTLWISRMAKVVVEGEVAPRVKLKRGVPGAISLVMRIAIITIGFLFAIAAAGFGMDKLTILIGALGVGIGFGLQNIFNNLVSGIILAFERPIQEGDIIEVGTLWGTVKEIGIRASTIFTFDGAEVIVPNGNLISNELINWTLTDRNRRVEVAVGVKYGTDPDKVLQLLRDVADYQDDILKEPAALALFTGFGDSSLDFKLLFWIASADNRFVVHSKVNVAVNDALKAAGIEIPFPQRDVYIKTPGK